jgi:hypothetical protein
MQNENVHIGIRVTPHSKTAYQKDLESSFAWKMALRKGQNFLYVLDQDKTLGYWLLNDAMSPVDGDYFNASDFEPYVEEQ